MVEINYVVIVKNKPVRRTIKQRLGWCNNCKENSTRVKCYRTKAEPEKLKRVEFCINKGCGYRLDLPPARGEHAK
jgi:hypothetical protein